MQLDVVLEQCASAEPAGGGLHLMAEWHECDCPRALLDSLQLIRDTCVAAVERAGLTMVGDRFHALPDGGITAMVLLAESHLAIRTWPLVATVALDVFVCNYRTDNRRKAQSLFDILRTAYRPGRENLLQIGRSGPRVDASALLNNEIRRLAHGVTVAELRFLRGNSCQ